MLLVAIVSLYLCTWAGAQNKYEDSYNYQRATEAMGNEDYSSALDYLKKEVNIHKDNAYAYFLIASLYNKYEEYGHAVANVNLALKYFPKKDKGFISMGYSLRGDVYYSIGENDKALSDYNAAVKASPDETEFLKDRGDFFYNTDRYDESDADYRKMLKIDPDDPYPRMGLGRNCMAREEYQEALQYFDYVASMYSNYSRALAFRAEAYFKLGDYINASSDVVVALGIDYDNKAFRLMCSYSEDAYTQLTTRLKAKALLEKNNEYWQYCIGVVNESTKRYDLAVEAYKKAMAIDPDAVTAYRIMNCYESVGNWEMAFKYVDRAIAIDPDDMYYIKAKANLYWYSGDLDSAISEITRCIEAEPESYLYYLHRGKFKSRKGDYEGAVEDFTTSIILEPENLYTYVYRGCANLKRGETGLAQEDFRMCVQKDTVPGHRSCAEFAYFYLGEKDKAIGFMDRLLEFDEEGYYYDAACLYSLIGEIEKSVEYLKTALESGYDDFNHLIRDSDLDNIREDDDYKGLMIRYCEFQLIPETDGEDVYEGEYVERVVEIPFTRTGGVTKVQCEINGLPLTFIFDTGASTVSISSLEATFMYKNGYLTADDVVGKSAFVDATGNISVGTIVNLRNVTFGGLELENVKASVVDNSSAPLLLGQTVLGRLGKVEIDYELDVLRITAKERKC